MAGKKKSSAAAQTAIQNPILSAPTGIPKPQAVMSREALNAEHANKVVEAQSVKPAQVNAPTGIAKPAAAVLDKEQTDKNRERAKSATYNRIMQPLEQVSNANAAVQATKNSPQTQIQAPEAKGLSMTEFVQRVNPQKSPEEQADEAKRQKRAQIISAIGDGISAMSNLYFSTKGAPNSYDPKTSMSAKTQEYWDKLNRERQENADRYNALLINAYSQDRAAGREDAKWKDQLAKWEDEKEQRKAERQQAADQFAATFNYNKEKDEADRQARKEMNDANNAAAAERQKAQLRSQEHIAKSRYAASSSRSSGGSSSSRSKDYTFNLGKGKGQTTVSAGAMNESNVKQLYNSLPEDVRKKAQQYYGEPVYETDLGGRKILKGYKPLSKEQMLEAIGANVEGNEELQGRIRELAGEKIVWEDGDNEDFSSYLAN